VKVLLTGRNGQVGYELERALAPLAEIHAFGRERFDLTDSSAVVARTREIRPDVIVNAAAYTNVDEAERDRGRAMQVNATAPGLLAAEARAIGALLVHYSTDYVFDGSKTTPYTEYDPPNPQSVYGESKLAGERAIQSAGGKCLILRTGWVYGARGRNFFLTILRLARERDELRIVDDQFGAPTSARALAAATAEILRVHGAGASGLYHLAAGGRTSWFRFAEAIIDLAQPRLLRTPRLVPISSAEYAALAKRPANSVLDCAKAGARLGIRIEEWRTCLEDVWRQFQGALPGSGAP
jgi:dTDP-4-dehydrorhamnose reductase